MRFFAALLIMGTFVGLLYAASTIMTPGEKASLEDPALEDGSADFLDDSTGAPQEEEQGGSGCASAASSQSENAAEILLTRFNPRDPREQLTARDQKLAKRAVLGRSNFSHCWKRFEVPLEQNTRRCAGHDPDLSTITVTGRHRSGFAQRVGVAVSSVRLFLDEQQAAEYFRLTTTRDRFRCEREGVRKDLRARKVSPRFEGERRQSTPRIGMQTAIYSIVFSVKAKQAAVRELYSVDLFIFQTGRAVGAVTTYGLDDPEEELAMAQVVSSRLTLIWQAG